MIENIVKQQKDNLFTVPNCQYGGDMWSADYYGEFKEGMEYPKKMVRSSFPITFR